MKKDAIPKNYPVGRIRLPILGRVNGRTLPSLYRSQYTGAAPRIPGKHLTSQEANHFIGAREGGTLQQFIAAKTNPTALKSQFPPTLSTETTPPHLSGEIPPGSGGALLQGREKHAFSIPLLSLQKGMTSARGLVWKHMSPEKRSKYLLQRAMGMVNL